MKIIFKMKKENFREKNVIVEKLRCFYFLYFGTKIA